MLKSLILLVSFLVIRSAAAQNVTATKSYVDKQDAVKRDKMDLTVYSSDPKTGWGIKSFDVEQSFDFMGDGSWGFQSWKAVKFSYDGFKAKWQDLDFEENWIESTNGFDFVAFSILPHKFTLSSLTGATHNAKWWIKPYADSLATSSTIAPIVTNAVRGVLGTVYDEKLGITWKQVMYDGNLYYVAVTNANVTEIKE